MRQQRTTASRALQCRRLDATEKTAYFLYPSVTRIPIASAVPRRCLLDFFDGLLVRPVLDRHPHSHNIGSLKRLIQRLTSALAVYGAP